VIDKPFTVTVEQADELIDLARDRGRVLTAFHNRRWDGDFLTVRNVVPRLGEIYLFEAHWDRFRPAIKQGWREEEPVGGGLLNDLGPHMFDQALQLFGAPQAISADVFAQRPGARADDYFDVTFHYASRRVCLRSSTLVSAPRPRFALHGTGGSFVKFGLDPQEEQLKNGLAPGNPQFGFTDLRGTFTQPDGASESIATDRGNYSAFYDQVASAILDGAAVPVDPADARTGLLLIDLARRAAETGQRLPVPDASSPEG
jgi:scyllo-inositol 2-dehydrogenase (NADP+)